MLAVITLPLLTSAWIAIARSAQTNKARRVAPLFFVLLCAFVLLWQRLDAAPWMIGYDGWKFSPLTWQVDWLATTIGLAIASVGLRTLIRRGPQALPKQAAEDAE